MNAKELFLMLESIGDTYQLARMRVVTSDGVSVTGVWAEFEKKQLVMVQPSKTTSEYKRVDL